MLLCSRSHGRRSSDCRDQKRSREVSWACRGTSLWFTGLGNQSPADKRQLADWLPRVLADDWDWLGRSDVVAGVPVSFARNDFEVLFDHLLPPRQSIASAHGEIMADRTGAGGTDKNPGLLGRGLRFVRLPNLPKRVPMSLTWPGMGRTKVEGLARNPWEAGRLPVSSRFRRDFRTLWAPPRRRKKR
jgi:hypothetical protein